MIWALVDTNVLIDVVEDSEWAEWASSQMRIGLAEGGLAINQAVFAELAAGGVGLEELDHLFPPQTYIRE